MAIFIILVETTDHEGVTKTIPQPYPYLLLVITATIIR